MNRENDRGGGTISKRVAEGDTVTCFLHPFFIRTRYIIHNCPLLSGRISVVRSSFTLVTKRFRIGSPDVTYLHNPGGDKEPSGK